MMNTTPAMIVTHAAIRKSRSGFSRGSVTGGAGVSAMHRIMPQRDDSRSGVRAMKLL
jgi:hypothetical protein